MAFLSEFIGKPVVDVDGESLGALVDLIGRFQKDNPHPLVVAVVVKTSSDPLRVPYSDVAIMHPAAVSLNVSQKDLHTYQPSDQDFYLAEDVLDKQIIDTDDVRVVRANDLELLRVNGSMVVSNVDVGAGGLIRRLGLDKQFKKIANRLGMKLKPSFISLDDVELIPSSQSLRLRIPGEKIASLHPADLADIISDLNRPESGHLLETLDVDVVADALEEMEPDFQATLVSQMADEKVADVLEEMSPDEAADLLAELPKERSEDLLELMADEEAEDVRKLLSFPEDSAGGIMTTDFSAVNADMTVEQVMTHLRETIEEDETVFYVYVVDGAGKLCGVFSLSDLIRAKPGEKVASFMKGRAVCVPLLEPQEKVAQVIAKYNLLAVPVVDEKGVLHGIVTVDDALDQIIPTAWKKRLPHMYH